MAKENPKYKPKVQIKYIKKSLSERILKATRFKINKAEVIGVIVALLIIIVSFIFLKESEVFYFIFAIALVIGGFPFFVFLIIESSATKEKEEMFLEFSKNLVESVKAGTPISKSILNVRKKDYGSLNPYINKLANQIALGIPIEAAFKTFARDVKSTIITRAITIISESEKAGGQIDSILESVVKSVAQVEKLKKERKAAMYSLVVQGYIIFMIFIVIMLVLRFNILPIAEELGEGMGAVEGGGGIGGGSGIGGSFGRMLGGEIATPEQLTRPFVWLLIVQGFFAGLVIGKLSEGSIKAGLKHSFVLVVLATLINTGAKVFVG